MKLEIFYKTRKYIFRLKKGDDTKSVEVHGSEATEEIEPLSEDYYTTPMNLNEGSQNYNRRL